MRAFWGLVFGLVLGALTSELAFSTVLLVLEGLGEDSTGHTHMGDSYVDAVGNIFRVAWPILWGVLGMWLATRSRRRGSPGSSG